MNNEIPKDIIEKTAALFTDATDRKDALDIIREVFERSWGVGQAQLARSLLVLSDGDIGILKNSLTDIEPRDTILDAERKIGNPGHYFIPPFDQLDKS